MKGFLIKSIILTASCIVVSNILPFFSEMSGTLIWYLVILFYALLTVFLRYWIAKSKSGSPLRFVTAVNGATVIKMLLTLAVITTYLVLKQPFPKQFVFGVFGVFLAFTSLFVIDTQRLVRER